MQLTNTHQSLEMQACIASLLALVANQTRIAGPSQTVNAYNSTAHNMSAPSPADINQFFATNQAPLINNEASIDAHRSRAMRPLIPSTILPDPSLTALQAFVANQMTANLALRNNQQSYTTEQLAQIVQDQVFFTQPLAPVAQSQAEAEQQTSEKYDTSSVDQPASNSETNRCAQAYSHQAPFPVKLYRLLLDVEDMGRQDIVSFTPSGRAVRIHKPKEFTQSIVPRYFRQKQLNSFKRQLNMYGFDRIPRGPDAGAFMHPLFERGRPDLLERIVRTSDADGSDVKKAVWKPDFRDV
jgi:hypothetical protein